jgi:hypothetical protein
MKKATRGTVVRTKVRQVRSRLGVYRVQRMSSFFSTWAKSLSLVARGALRAAARAEGKWHGTAKTCSL